MSTTSNTPAMTAGITKDQFLALLICFEENMFLRALLESYGQRDLAQSFGVFIKSDDFCIYPIDRDDPACALIQGLRDLTFDKLMLELTIQEDHVGLKEILRYQGKEGVQKVLSITLIEDEDDAGSESAGEAEDEGGVDAGAKDAVVAANAAAAATQAVDGEAEDEGANDAGAKDAVVATDAAVADIAVANVASASIPAPNVANVNATAVNAAVATTSPQAVAGDVAAAVVNPAAASVASASIPDPEGAIVNAANVIADVANTGPQAVAATVASAAVVNAAVVTTGPPAAAATRPVSRLLGVVLVHDQVLEPGRNHKVRYNRSEPVYNGPALSRHTKKQVNANAGLIPQKDEAWRYHEIWRQYEADLQDAALIVMTDSQWGDALAFLKRRYKKDCAGLKSSLKKAAAKQAAAAEAAAEAASEAAASEAAEAAGEEPAAEAAAAEKDTEMEETVTEHVAEDA